MPCKTTETDNHCACCALRTVTSDQKYYPLQSLPFNRYPGACTLEQGSAATKRATAQLKKIQESIRVLQARERYLQSVTGQHSSFRSPINRLPDELLLEIFHCIPKDSHGHYSRNSSLPGSSCGGGTSGRLERYPLDPVWMVSHVCGRWRTVALACPSLWSSLFYDTITKYKAKEPAWRADPRRPYTHTTPHCAGRYELLRLQGERAKQAKLYVTLSVSSNRGDITALKWIMETWERWAELTVTGRLISTLLCGFTDAEEARRTVSSSTSIGLSALRKLTVKGRIEPDFDVFIQHAPKLCTLITHSNDIRLQTPHESLTHLDLRPIFTNCHDLLRNTPNVRTLILRDADFIPSEFSDDDDDEDSLLGGTSTVPMPSTLVELPHLTELSLFLSAGDSKQLYNFLVLPSLEKLIIGGNEYPHQLEHVRDLIERSAARITSLTLRAIEDRLDELETMLRMIPNLRELEVYALETDTLEEDADLLRLFIFGAPPPETTPIYLCPQLERLKIDMPEINLDFLSLLLRSRAKSTVAAKGSLHRKMSSIKEVAISAWYPEGVRARLDHEGLSGELEALSLTKFKVHPQHLVDNDALDLMGSDDEDEVSDFDGLDPVGGGDWHLPGQS